MQHLTDRVDHTDPSPVVQHLESCELCRRRSRFVEDRVGAMPAMGGGLFMRGMALVDRLSGWQQSAVAGALFILAMGGVGVPILLVFAVLNRSPAMAGIAVGLVLLLTLSGAPGGIVFYITRSMRRRGTVGHYISSALTVYGYLAVVFGMLAVAASFVGWEAIDPSMAEMLTMPTGWTVIVVGGGAFGIFFGRVTRE